MTIKAVSTSNHNQEREYLDFLSTLKQAVIMLDTLGQIQATVGGLSMSNRAQDTFETRAWMDNYIGQIEENKREGI